jgi:hypothetical protein
MGRRYAEKPTHHRRPVRGAPGRALTAQRRRPGRGAPRDGALAEESPDTAPRSRRVRRRRRPALVRGPAGDGVRSQDVGTGSGNWSSASGGGVLPSASAR